VLREVAEYPNAFVDLSPGQERIDTGRYALCLERSRFAATVQRQRFAADELDEVIREVRGLLRDRSRDRTQWEVGSAARPRDLVERLLERGLTRDDEPFATAVALCREPPAPPPGLTARRVATFAEFAAAKEVQWEAFGTPAARILEDRPGLAQEWSTSSQLMHAVWDGDALIAAGTSVPTPHGLALFGGATHPAARGRGAYRALIAARWREAESRGLDALVTQAGAMSYPILEGLGFEAVGHVDMLVDDFAGGGGAGAGAGAD
jgi:GNAT superfamily N-acetyltransferase